MTRRPYVLLSVATSIDGHIDDTTPDRLLLSNEADFDRVDQVRADSDAVMIGAGTMRADNPRMLVKNEQRRKQRLANGQPEYPTKITVTKSGNLDPALRWFRSPGYKIVYTTDHAAPYLAANLAGLAEVVPLGPVVDFAKLLDNLADHDIGHLMVEGGEQVHTEFLAHGLVDEIHFVVAPLLVGSGPRFVAPTRYPWPTTRRMHLAEARTIGDVVLLRYLPNQDRPTQ